MPVFCAHCFVDIDDLAEWPDDRAMEDGLWFHNSCVEQYRLERAEAHVGRT